MNLKERIEFLEKQIVELDRHKESLSSSFDSTSESLDVLLELSLKQSSPELLKATTKTLKKQIVELGDILRIHSDIIRKVSVSSSDIINQKISELEKIELGMISKLELALETKKHEDVVESNNFAKENLPKINPTELPLLISICRGCIKDTLEKLIRSDVPKGN